MKFTITDALLKLLPNVEWKLTDNDLSTLEIYSHGNYQIPTIEDIENAINELEAQNNAEQEKVIARKTAAEAKLLALGLTIDDLRAIGL